jgi:peptidoglycan/LPS O-acetylase OafA/YrhL
VNRISTLDGWRGVAILLVLFDHLQDSFVGHYIRPWTQTGQHGVTIFFVLSGFLITSKLLEGHIDLKRFYLRRLFRLMPVAWTFLGFLILLGALAGAHFVTPAGVAACLFFYRNFAGNVGSAVTGHFWSLSLEEQFYLVWPCVLLLAGAKRSKWIAAAGAAACAIYRCLFWAYYDRNNLDNQSQVRADALLVGCLLALFMSDPQVRTAIGSWSMILAFPSLASLIFCIARFHWLAPLYECISIAVLIAATTLHNKSLLALPFSLRPLTWLGTISYSVYVWQEFFMPFRNLAIFCFVMPLFILGSYYWIERPLTRLGHLLTRSQVQNEASCVIAG